MTPGPLGIVGAGFIVESHAQAIVGHPGLRLTLNGTVWQQGSTADMIFSCAGLVAFASRLCTLRPGDIILTGTPSGVGATTSTWLADGDGDGDEMVAEVHGLGKLITPVRTA